MGRDQNQTDDDGKHSAEGDKQTQVEVDPREYEQAPQDGR